MPEGPKFNADLAPALVEDGTAEFTQIARRKLTQGRRYDAFDGVDTPKY